MTRQMLLGLAAVSLLLGACGGGNETTGCKTEADCEDGEICSEGTCQPGPVPACDPACEPAAPVCDEASGTCKTCTLTEGCLGAKPICDTSAAGGVCVGCLDTTDCTAPSVCDATTRACVGCTPTEGCSGAAPVCNDGTCVVCTAALGCDGGLVCDTSVDGGACVTCTAQAGCSGGLVCDTAVDGGECVTCTADGKGCSGTTPICDTGVRGGECVECGSDDDCTAPQFCDGGRRQCVTCNDSNTGCQNPWPLCDVTANDGDGLCVGCLSDYDCGLDYPVCHPEKKQCATCVSDDDCDGDTPHCDTAVWVGQCKACVTNDHCGEATPICDPQANNFKGACGVCSPSTSEGCVAQWCDGSVPGGRCLTCDGTNKGCRGATPFCDTSVEDGFCVACTAEGAGCSGTTPICDIAAADGKGACVACLANGAGCEDPTPICDVSIPGGACATCTATLGCTGSTPLCDVSAAGGAGLCVACLTHADCTPQTCDPVTHSCVGCSTSDDCPAATPVCDELTTACVVCTATAGCADPTPICDLSAGGGVGACVACVAATDCDARESCDDNICVNQSSLDIAAIRASTGTTGINLPVRGALVTHTRPAVGSDPAGFFIQGEQTGPAIFVAVDPATTTPPIAVGDEISFVAVDKARLVDVASQHRITAISDLTQVATAVPVAPMIQDLTNATDLVTNLDAYESELVALTGTLTTAFAASGGGHVFSTISTAGLSTGTLPELRMPSSLRDAMDLTNGCDVSIVGTVWRFNAKAQPSVYAEADFVDVSCPAPNVTTVTATSSTEVLVGFDRLLDPASVLPNGTQFGASDGLEVTAAAVNGKTLTLTTSSQTGGAIYTLSIDPSVLGRYGAPVVALPLSFTGYVVPVGALVINEVDYDQNSTDTMEFVEVFNGTTTDVALSALDLVFVNGSGSGSVYMTVPLGSGTLVAGGYAVAGNPAVTVPAGVTKVDFAGNTMQNGSPDAVFLYDRVTKTVVDSLSYAGAAVTPTITHDGVSVSFASSHTALTDSGSAALYSLIRWPNGSVTSTAVDWAATTTPTAGAANVLTAP